MHAVYVGLLLIAVTWAALGEKSKGSVALPHLDKIRQESTETTLQEGEKALARPASFGARGTEDGDGHLQQQEASGAALRSKARRRRPDTVPGRWVTSHREKNPRNGPRSIPGVNPKKEENHQRHLEAKDNFEEHRRSHQMRRGTSYLAQLPPRRRIPSDFEGSGAPDLQDRGDNDGPFFSGDGQPFKDTPGQGGVGPYLESVGSQTESGEAELANPPPRRPGSKDTPGRDQHGVNAVGARDATAQEAGAAGASLGDSRNDITGSSNFRELPGKEGHRAEGSSHAHQGEVDFHYPQVPSKGKTKEGGRDNTESADYNEIPKNGKGGSRKGTEESNRNEKQRFSSKGESQGWLIPSHSLDNEIENEIDSHSGPSNEGNIIALGGKKHNIPHRQNSSTRSKGLAQRRGTWYHQKTYSNRSPPKGDDSSESTSDSGSSSQSDGD